MWRIKDWNDLYENDRSRQVKKAQWVPMPNKQDGDGYRLLLTGHAQGEAHYGAFDAVVLLASKCHPRGDLLQSTGEAHTLETISAKTGFRVETLRVMFDRCCDKRIGWIEWVAEPEKSIFDGDKAGRLGVTDDVSRVTSGPVDESRTRRGRGSGIGITSSSSSSSRVDDSVEPESKKQGGDPDDDVTALVFQCLGGGNWLLSQTHLRELERQWPELDVLACLKDIQSRQSREDRFLKPSGRMSSSIQSWLRNEQQTFRRFLKAGDNGATVEPKPDRSRKSKASTVEDRTEALYRQAGAV